MLKNLICLFVISFAFPCLAAIEPVVEPSEENFIEISETELIEEVTADIEQQLRQRQNDALVRQMETLQASQPEAFSGLNEVELGIMDDAEKSQKKSALTGENFIELQKVSQELNVKRGSTFDVVAIEEEGRKWSFQESEKDKARLLGKNQDGDMVIFNFEAVEDGFGRFYFDYIEKNGSDITVIESRIVDIVVGAPGAQTN